MSVRCLTRWMIGIEKMKTPKPQYKMYTVQSNVKARTLSEARRISMKMEPQEIWINRDWKEDHLACAIGFDDGMTADEEED